MVTVVSGIRIVTVNIFFCPTDSQGHKRTSSEAFGNEDSDSEEETPDEVRLYEDGFKDRYYEAKFGLPPGTAFVFQLFIILLENLFQKNSCQDIPIHLSGVELYISN